MQDHANTPRYAHIVIIVVYYLLCGVAWIVLIPLLLCCSANSKYRRSIPARFFPFLSYLFAPHSRGFCHNFNPHIWLHACSFGEVKSLEPIINALCNQQPTSHILLTTTTQTGFDLARTTYGGRIRVEFLPFEIFLPFYKRRLQQLQSLVVTEAELWLGLFHIATSLNARTLLINARISARSYAKYLRFARFYRALFRYIDIVFAQSQIDKDRLSTLGANNIHIFGNLKLLTPITTSKTYPKPNRLVIIGASTHKGEEELILQAFRTLKNTEDSSLLILAPRHPERFTKVADLLATYPLASARFTQDIDALAKPSIDVVLLDVLGELHNLYAIADIVVLGGAFIQAGGHNPLEPAFFHTKLISGEAIFNQEALFACIDGYVLCKANELASTLLAHKSLPRATYKPMQAHLSTLVHHIIYHKDDNDNNG